MNLFKSGDFTLNSGAKSKWKLECDALTDADIETLAYMIGILVGPFHSVEGIPRGGLKLAAAMEKHRYNGESFAPLPYLIVDDVLTSGGSMERRRRELANPIGLTTTGAAIIGVVIFSRGQLPPWIKAVCPLPRALWLNPKM